jgi:hypothetical protein
VPQYIRDVLGSLDVDREAESTEFFGALSHLDKALRPYRTFS